MADEVSMSTSGGHPSDVSPGRKRKKRVRTWTANDRAKHRIFEKGRREAFNERLMDLAGLLPSLSNAKKDSQLSKHVIVDESVKQHQAQAALIQSLRNDMDRVLAEHQKLLQELNAFRDAVNSQSTNVEGPLAIGAPYVPPTTADVNTASLPRAVLSQPTLGPVLDDEGTWMLSTQDCLNSGTLPAEAAPLVFHNSTPFNPLLSHANELPQELSSPMSQAMGFFDPSTFTAPSHNDWNRNPQMNTFEIFNIDNGGGLHSSIISPG